MRGREASTVCSAASSIQDLDAPEGSGRAGQPGTAAGSTGSLRESVAAAVQLARKLRHASRRLTRLCERGPGVWRPVLTTVFLALLFASPLLWADKRHHFQGSRRAGYRFLARFTHNAHGQPIYTGEPAGVRGVSKRVRAAIVVLARDGDCDGVLHSMARMEQRFNAKFRYPYVFLNNAAFGAEFINRTSAATSARTLYGEIPPAHWGYPSYVDPAAAADARRELRRQGVLYGDRESYHHMCRYYSGFFQFHPLLKEFDYFWRMEPDVHYYCDLDYDPFLYMQDNGIKYGFVITIEELPATIPSLWATTQAFINKHPESLSAANLLDFVRDPNGNYNLCHFWSNFELGDLNFFRSKAYQEYFDFLDRSGGFFLERWGDAPVHSLAAAMFLNSTEVHFFQDIGYRHNSYKHCPAVQRNNCDCDAVEAVAFHSPSFGACHRRWDTFVAAEEAARAQTAADDSLLSKRSRSDGSKLESKARVGVWQSG